MLTHRVWSAPGYIVISMELADASLLDLLDAYQTEYKDANPSRDPRPVHDTNRGRPLIS